MEDKIINIIKNIILIITSFIAIIGSFSLNTDKSGIKHSLSGETNKTTS